MSLKIPDKLIVYEKALQRRGFDTLNGWNMLYQLSDLHLYIIHNSKGNPHMIIFFIVLNMCKYRKIPNISPPKSAYEPL